MITLIISVLVCALRRMRNRNCAVRIEQNGTADSVGRGVCDVADTVEIPRPRKAVTARSWITGARESRWHASEVFVSSGAAAATAACGHTVRGLHERRGGYDPPEQRHRSVCGPCLHAIDYVPPRAVLRRRLPQVAAHLGPQWPERAPATGSPATVTALPPPANPPERHRPAA